MRILANFPGEGAFSNEIDRPTRSVAPTAYHELIAKVEARQGNRGRPLYLSIEHSEMLRWQRTAARAWNWLLLLGLALASAVFLMMPGTPLARSFEKKFVRVWRLRPLVRHLREGVMRGICKVRVLSHKASALLCGV